MLLHEAVKKARKELGLSQDKLSELAGIQRRQLATLEAGGNVTLATLRKVLAQLPNLETFRLDTVTATVTRDVPPAEVAQSVQQALRLMGTALHSLIDTLGKGQPPDPQVREQIDQMNQFLDQAHGYTAEDLARRREQAPRPAPPPMTEEELKEFFTAVKEAADEGVRELEGLTVQEESDEADSER
jgi:predicted transcriptional regulator